MIQPHGKTESSSRTISIASEAVEMLSRREHLSDVVFPSILGRLRDASNTEADWRANRAHLGYAGMTSHAFRKTVATALDTAGMSTPAIAEYLSHKRPSMTQDVYMSRTTGTEMVAVTLGGMFGASSESVAESVMTKS